MLQKIFARYCLPIWIIAKAKKMEKQSHFKAFYFIQLCNYFSTILHWNNCSIFYITVKLYFSKCYFTELYQAHVLCAGYEAAEDGSCDGDSGGPLLVFSTRYPRNSNLIQWKLLNVITLGPRENDHIVQMITISESTPNL